MKTTGLMGRELKKQVEVGQDPRKLTSEELVQYVRINVLAAVKELTEVLDEIGWKPWATSDHFNRREFAEEIADVQLFLDNLKLALLAPGEGQRWLNPDQLEEMFVGLVHGKIDNCLNRHRSGDYDGFEK